MSGQYPGDAGAGELDEAEQAALRSLFEVALTDEPDPAVSPLAVIAAAKRAEREAERPTDTARPPRWVRPVRWVAGLAAAAAVVIGVVNVLPDFASTTTAGSTSEAGQRQFVDSGSPAAAPPGAEGGSGLEPSSYSAAGSSSRTGAQPSGAKDLGVCPGLPSAALAAVVARLPAGVDPTPAPVAGCGPRSLGAAQFSGGSTIITVFLSAADPACSPPGCVRSPIPGATYAADDRYEVTVAVESAAQGPGPDTVSDGGEKLSGTIAAAVLSAI